ncbi:hypothetical protein A2380_03900 [candidate division WWE3 bacterium RIFOXYB1_FULL_43_24]|uniref:Uncharacterized protein n=2 Tax=Katanobacteria TaxID=422282 RepID=A0A0G1AYF0_UNCKA|nr:MAG: hypothetical protein UU92_C0003G0037 [candidate division WWE3 bacterium GW2011_GWA1_42_12]KKS35023.1 MAG: hypothetical protein UU97_C0003G0037 [candidate division WWE3 bacterium GW2011_GWD1_42_14]KKS39111.1 MAG: hypothetical protein UV00_C0004G0037 [candidate division WWE3 bacterium GW2011_GWF1_42_14]KKS40641.1 MAG: hypothetical protein UV03_C0004G0037 [candidate division WWE3 bacterium GW2011_GWE1_42_16]KKS67019.1 MAG: hypothetical protein UV35_C0004G0025 [candidate division WWE3 bacte
MLTYLLGCPLIVVLVIAVLVKINKSEFHEQNGQSHITIEEQQALKRQRKAANRARQQQQLIARAQAMRAAGLDPENTDDVQKWKNARKQERQERRRLLREERREESTQLLRTEKTFPGGKLWPFSDDDDYVNDPLPDPPWEYYPRKEKEEEKGSFLAMLLWD